jgi:hypothetical protein
MHAAFSGISLRDEAHERSRFRLEDNISLILVFFASESIEKHFVTVHSFTTSSFRYILILSSHLHLDVQSETNSVGLSHIKTREAILTDLHFLLYNGQKLWSCKPLFLAGNKDNNESFCTS